MSEEIETTHVILLDNGKSVTLVGSGITLDQIKGITRILNNQKSVVTEEPFRLNHDQWTTGPCHDGMGNS